MLPVFTIGGTVSSIHSLDTNKEKEAEENNFKSEFAKELNKEVYFEKARNSVSNKYKMKDVEDGANIKTNLTRLKLENEQLKLKIKDCLLEDERYKYLKHVYAWII